MFRLRRSAMRRGSVMVYMAILFPIFIVFCSIGVDYGRMVVAKSEAQGVADAAVRYAAHGMVSSSTPAATAYANAAAVAAQSTVDGSPPVIATSDVVCGYFTPGTNSFVPDPMGNAVKVTVHQSFTRTGAIPMFIRAVLPNLAPQVRAAAIAQSNMTSYDISPPASGNLWLSGMPDNSTTQNMRPDNSTVWDSNGTSGDPRQRPLEVNLASASMAPGSSISFEGITGTASWQNNNSGSSNSADGDATYLVANGVAPAGSVPGTSNNGMSNVRAPIGAVMAVFLDDNSPASSSPPSNLDFGTAAQRDYTTINPVLKQVFFVGDGKRSTGESQTIVIPRGATRVYFGMMDAWQWNDNLGTFKTRMYNQSNVYLVR